MRKLQVDPLSHLSSGKALKPKPVVNESKNDEDVVMSAGGNATTKSNKRKSAPLFSFAAKKPQKPHIAAQELPELLKTICVAGYETVDRSGWRYSFNFLSGVDAVPVSEAQIHISRESKFKSFDNQLCVFKFVECMRALPSKFITPDTTNHNWVSLADLKDSGVFAEEKSAQKMLQALYDIAEQQFSVDSNARYIVARLKHVVKE